MWPLLSVGAELAFCLGDAKTEPTNSSMKISAIASFFIGLVSPLAGSLVSLLLLRRRTGRRIAPGSALSRISHARGRNVRASGAPQPRFEISRLFHHARRAARRIHCGICARRLKTATRSIADLNWVVG